MPEYNITDNKLRYLKYIGEWLAEHFPAQKFDLAFYCGGRFTREILFANKDIIHKLSIKVIFDDNYSNINQIEGIPCDSIQNISQYSVSNIFLATDTHEQLLKNKLFTIKGERVNIISISYIETFSGLSLNRINFLSSIWNWLSNNFERSQKVAFYCGGKFTRDILSLNYFSHNTLNIPVIFDDNFETIKNIETIKCDSATSYNNYNFDVIFIATDSCEQQVKESCKSKLGESNATILGISDISNYFLKTPGVLLKKEIKYIPNNQFPGKQSSTLGIHVFIKEINTLQQLNFLEKTKLKFNVILSVSNQDIKEEQIKKALLNFKFNDIKIVRTKAVNSFESLHNLPQSLIYSTDFICNLGFDYEGDPIINNAYDHSINCLLFSDSSINYILNELSTNNKYTVCFPKPKTSEINHKNHLSSSLKINKDFIKNLSHSGLYFRYDSFEDSNFSSSFYWIKSSELIKKIDLYKKHSIESLSHSFNHNNLLICNSFEPDNTCPLFIENLYEKKEYFGENDFSNCINLIAFYSLNEKEYHKYKVKKEGKKLFPTHKIDFSSITQDTSNYACTGLELIEEQIKLAKSFGIKGFCYRLKDNYDLLKVNSIIELSEKKNFKLSLEISESLLSHTENSLPILLKCLESSSYLKIFNRPLLLINFISNKESDLLIERLKSSGLNPYFSASNLIHNKDSIHKFDALVENPFHHSEFLKVPDRKKELNAHFFHKGLICDYNEFYKALVSKKIELNKPIIRALGPYWDPSVSQGDNCNILVNANPEAYNRWLSHLIEQERESPNSSNTIFLYSWNERKNGPTLEPNNYNGYAILNSTARALLRPSPWQALQFEKNIAPSISIIIPCYNNWDYTYNCIESILYNCIGIDYEIIIGDDNSSDHTKDALKCFKNITVIRSDTNQGFIENCNNSAKVARGKYLYFLNNDTFVHKGSIEELAELLEQDQTIGMTGSKLIFADNTLQEAGGIIWEDGSGWNYGRGSSPDLPEYNYLKDVDYISGASIMIRKELWDRIGGFDIRFKPAYYEDSDLAFMVRRMGFRVVYNPKSVITHFEGISSGVDLNSGVKKHQVVNKEKFFQKHKITLKNHFPNGNNVFQARDRSTNKQTILVIDHYIPEFDKDAGSRTMFTCLVRMIKLGFSVKFIGDNFVRTRPYTDYLEEIGVEVLYGNKYAHSNWQQWLQENGSYIDIAFLNRPHISTKYIDHIKQWTDACIIYNVVDLHHVRLKEEYKLTHNSDTLELSKKYEEIENHLVVGSDIVFSVSNDEVTYINETWPGYKGRWLPVFSVNSYQSRQYEDKNFTERKNILFVGSYKHSPNKDAIDWFLKYVFPKLVKNHPGLIFNIVGDDPDQSLKRISSSNNIKIHGHVTDLELSQLYSNCRIVVIPLQYGAGLKGKTMESMLYNVPFIGTKYAIEGFPEKEKFLNSFDSPEEFTAKAISLLGDKSSWSKERAFYSKYLKKYFSDKTIDEALLEAFHTKKDKK